MTADRQAIHTFLESAWRRRVALLALAGAGAAVAAALALLGAGWLGLMSWGVAILAGVACVLAGAAEGVWRAVRARGRIAHDIERQAPQCRNLLITAAELPAGPRPEIVGLVERHAAELVRNLDAPSLFPLRRSVLTLVAGIVVWGSLAAVARARPLEADVTPSVVGVVDVAPFVEAVEVVVTPPEYTARSPRTVVDPTRLEVVSGSRLEIVVRALGGSVALTTLEGSFELLSAADGTFRTELEVSADGFLALEARAGDRASPRRLIGLVAIPDAPPLVRITEPGRDLFLPVPEGEIPLVATARDDFGMQELRITYTIVSGSGENFEFTEGELPVTLSRDDASSWSARTVLSPSSLGLSLGDTAVYRAVARDKRPGAPEVESDAFVVEIVGENAAIAGGFALESDEEREALSQRMVIIKTERLLEQRGDLSEQEYRDAARRIAAEQRLVRAEFVFMMGGEIQDEVEEAEHEHEIAEGRLELRGRQEMSRSVLFMSQAAAQLTQADLEAALPLELAALEALQSALARSRYILRTLADRESIDLARRLSGEPGTARGARQAGAVVDDPELAGLRRMLAEVATVAARDELDQAARATLSELAEAALRLDPSSELMRRIAEDLSFAATTADGGDERVAAVITALMERIAARLPLAPRRGQPDPALAGALVDEMKAAGGSG